MWAGTSAPALHVERKSRFGPCDEARAITAAVMAARGIEVPLPIIFGKRCLGWVVGQFGSPYVWLRTERLDMAGFPSLGMVQQAMTMGQRWQQVFYKAGGLQATNWTDLWSATGDPVAGSFTGSAFTARQFDDTVAGGILHGGNVSPNFKCLSYMSVADVDTSALTTCFVLYDRVLAYEACTFNANVSQNMTNTLAAQRYISAGQPGLQVAVVAQTSTGATASNLTAMTYVDNSGNPGQSLPMSNLAVAPGFAATLVACPYFTGPTGLFMPLQPGDTGVRSITNYTTSAANTGTLTFVLCRPLAFLPIPSSGVAYELDTVFQLMNMVRIYDGAHLSFFAIGGAASLGGTIQGRLEVVFG